jgi:outer membrane lipoprotein SlyB
MGFWVLVVVGAGIGLYVAGLTGAIAGMIIGAGLSFVLHMLQQRALAADAAARQGIVHLQEEHGFGIEGTRTTEQPENLRKLSR